MKHWLIPSFPHDYLQTLDARDAEGHHEYVAGQLGDRQFDYLSRRLVVKGIWATLGGGERIPNKAIDSTIMEHQPALNSAFRLFPALLPLPALPPRIDVRRSCWSDHAWWRPSHLQRPKNATNPVTSGADPLGHLRPPSKAKIYLGSFWEAFASAATFPVACETG